MTTEEVYTAIKKSNDENAYIIVYNINNDKIDEAVGQIQDRYQCDEKTAAGAADLLRLRFFHCGKEKSAPGLTARQAASIERIL